MVVMTKILAVAGPKGGVGKSTEAAHIAAIAGRDYKLNVLLNDADPNASAFRYADRGDENAMPFDISQATGAQASHLAQLRRRRHYDLAVVDTAGERKGGFEAMLRGAEDRPVADLLVMPVRPRQMDLEPVVDVLRTEVIPLGVPYMLVFTMVRTVALHIAQQRQLELQQLGFTVANAIIRDFAVYEDAHERGVTVLDLPGQRSKARSAEAEQRALTYEALKAIGLAA